jgi:maleylpyruvate isomerase
MDHPRMSPRLPAPIPVLFEGLAASTARLNDWLFDLGLTDAQVRASSELPSWSRGHVLTHLARNADGILRTIDGALRGEDVERYPGDSRDREIDAGSTRPAAVLVDDAVNAANALADRFSAINEAGLWDRPTAENRTAGLWLYARWREVEIHRVDLGLGYQPSSWPSSFVSTALPDIAAGRGLLDQVRTMTGPDWATLCWLIGRTEHARSAIGDLPELEPWR